jgi:hypothetical protein
LNEKADASQVRDPSTLTPHAARAPTCAENIGVVLVFSPLEYLTKQDLLQRRFKMVQRDKRQAKNDVRCIVKICEDPSE